MVYTSGVAFVHFKASVDMEAALRRNRNMMANKKVSVVKAADKDAPPSRGNQEKEEKVRPWELKVPTVPHPSPSHPPTPLTPHECYAVCAILRLLSFTWLIVCCTLYVVCRYCTLLRYMITECCRRPGADR